METSVTFPQLPARSAAANEVRAYLEQILISKLDLTADLAHQTASSWSLGRGSELLDSSIQVFIKLFGDNTGWLLYRMIHDEELEEWKRSVVGRISSYMIVISVLLTVYHSCYTMWKNSSCSESRVKSFFWITFGFFLIGLATMNYAFFTPSSNGVLIGIIGSMIAFPAGYAVVITFYLKKNVLFSGNYNLIPCEDTLQLNQSEVGRRWVKLFRQ